MDELLSEKEQIEAIRSWWRENGRYVVSGIVIGVGLLFGWSYWNDRQGEAQLEASALYEQLLSDVADSRVSAAEEKTGRITDEYPATAYAPQARLAMARLYMDTGRDEDAAEQLRQLLASGEASELAMVARLRLGKILLYQDKPEEVIELLEGHRESAFGARYSETLGDAYVAEGRVEDAAGAYSSALADNPNLATVDRTLLQMKIDDLPEVPGSDAMQGDVADGAPAGHEDLPGASEPLQPATAAEPAGEEAGESAPGEENE